MSTLLHHRDPAPNAVQSWLLAAIALVFLAATLVAEVSR